MGDISKTDERDAIPKGLGRLENLWNDTALAHSFFKYSGEKLF
jgi:hypothetical protein